ncbi:putative SP-containing membrane protein [Vairimorpha necatrix]|uniref:SP-containing membrane protein n=1 Tax=Vairimorpha necatrix TaxID=6039 RepID=A0AAX4JCI9_9MICR
MRYPFYVNAVIFFIKSIKTSINVDDCLKEAVNSPNVCEPLVTQLYVNYSYDLNAQVFHDFIWNAITNHEIIARMTSNDTSENSFVNRSNIMKEKFFEFLIYGDYNPNVTISKQEKDFLAEMISDSTILYDILRTCYKDVINDASSTTETIKEIIRQHTCFIQDGISAKLPLPVIKFCKGQLKPSDDCLNDAEDWDCFRKYLKMNGDLLTKAECTNSNASFLSDDFLSKYIRENMIENITAELDNIYGEVDSKCGNFSSKETLTTELNKISVATSEEFGHVTETNIAEINNINEIIDENYDIFTETITAELYNLTETNEEFLNVTKNIFTDINISNLIEQNERLENITETFSIETQKLSEPMKLKSESLVSAHAPEINTVINEKSSRLQTIQTTETPNTFDTIATEFKNIISYMGVCGSISALIFLIFILFGILFMLFKYKCRKRGHLKENIVSINSKS